MAREKSNMWIRWGSFVRLVAYASSLGLFIVAYRAVSLFATPRRGRIFFATDSAALPRGNLACVLEAVTAVDGIHDVHVSARKNLWAPRGLWKTIQFAYHARTSRVIVIDDYVPELNTVRLHPDTAFVQLWHASGAFKKVGFARSGLPGGPRKGSTAHRGYTAAIVSAEGVRESYATAFNMSVEHVTATGIPKTDRLLDPSWANTARASVRRELGIPRDARTTLVATTFHGHGQPTATIGSGHIDWSVVADGLPGDVILVKNHPFTRGIAPSYPPHARVIDITERDDIDDVMAASDVVVTDFSSVIFDAALLKKPVVYLFADTEGYEASRGFFFAAESYLWGPKAHSEKSLIAAILKPTVNQAVFDAAYTRHLSACDGHATERVVHDIIVPAAGISR